MPFSKVGLARAALIVAAFVALEILCRAGIIPRATMIPPTEMAAALWQILESGRANADIAFTLINTLAAIGLSVFLGFWLGAALHALPRLRRVFEPLLSAYYAVPVFVFYPLFIVAFGVGRTALIVMGAMFGVVAMIVNTMTGLDRVDFDNRTMYGMLLLLLLAVMIVNGALSHWEKRLHLRFGQS